MHMRAAQVGTRMGQYEGLDEDEVIKSLSKVNVARRTVNQKLIEMDFGVKKKKRRAREANQ
jgi:hypothetical protein